VKYGIEIGGSMRLAAGSAERKNLTRIPAGLRAPEEVNVVIEIPQGSSNKMEYNEDWGAFVLDRTLYSPLYYPCNYGFIPSTLFEDGDPLDVLVFSSHPVPMGTVLTARPVGVLRMRDDKGQDDKIVAVFSHDPRYEHVRALEDLPEHRRREIVHFFRIYKELEDKAVEVDRWEPAAVAHDLISRYSIREVNQSAQGSR
jgi:inorganic pyrophosphatase